MLAPLSGPVSVRLKLLSVVTGGVSLLPVSVRLANDNVPAAGAAVSTTTVMTLLVELLPAASVTSARN